MPRFSLDWNDSLVPTLQTMGLKAVFDPTKADLSPMGLPTGSCINEVHHKTRLQIDENGTIATAATDVLAVNALDMDDKEAQPLILNRPFVLLLREQVSGAILFAGIVNNPQTD